LTLRRSLTLTLALCPRLTLRGSLTLTLTLTLTLCPRLTLRRSLTLTLRWVWNERGRQRRTKDK
jgi:hypothetical protein